MQRAEFERVKQFVSNLDMVVEKELREHEVLIVSSKKLGLKNLVIDLEDDQVLFKLRLGRMKNDFEDIEGTAVSRYDVEKEFSKLNNPFYEGGMKTGQFTWDESDEDILVFAEQEFLPSMTQESFENVLNGFSEVLVDKIEFIQYATQTTQKEG